MSIQERILVVDDDDSIRRILGEHLKRAGYHITLAGSAVEALDLLEHQAYDLTLSDIMMPGMDGLELLHQIKAINPNMPVAIMTGLGTADHAITALNRGAYNFVLKPFRKAEILKVIRRGLDYRAPIRRAEQLLTFARACIEHTIPSRLDLVSDVTAQMTDLANAMGYFTNHNRMEFRLVADELITNAILHGNREDESKQVQIHLDIDKERLALTVRDEGEGFNLNDIPDPRDAEHLLKCSGRGILLCRTNVDELTYNEKGNQVTAVVRAARSGPGAGR